MSTRYLLPPAIRDESICHLSAVCDLSFCGFRHSYAEQRNYVWLPLVGLAPQPRRKRTASEERYNQRPLHAHRPCPARHTHTHTHARTRTRTHSTNTTPLTSTHPPPFAPAPLTTREPRPGLSFRLVRTSFAPHRHQPRRLLSSHNFRGFLLPHRRSSTVLLLCCRRAFAPLATISTSVSLFRSDTYKSFPASGSQAGQSIQFKSLHIKYSTFIPNFS